MDLVSRFGRHAVAMAGFQLFVLVCLLGYGPWPQSLGSHMVLPGLVTCAAFGAMIWLTITRPWEPEPITGAATHVGGTARHLWDHGLIVGVTLGVAHLYRGVFATGKETLREIAGVGETRSVQDVLAQVRIHEHAKAWAADPLGADLLSGGGVILALFLPAALLLILRLFLPR